MRFLIFAYNIYFIFVLKIFMAMMPIAINAEELNNHIHGAHKECPLPERSMDIINCALEFHPLIKRSQLVINSTSKLEEQALQRPNPTFSSRYIKGDHNGQSLLDLETNVLFTLELGKKRNSRKNFALARKAEAIASNELIKSDVKIATILNMHRLRQVFEEKKNLNETISGFSKVIGQLRQLPRLSAEQEASLTLFEMALEEIKINESELFEEEKKLEHYFHVSTGHSIDEIDNFLPEAPINWPIVTNKNGRSESPDVKRLKSLVTLAQGELEIQKSNAWPDIKIGPSFSLDRNGEVENKLMGFNLQIPIPLFQANGGGRAYAQSEVARSIQNVTLTLSEENHERFEQYRIYRSSVSILNKAMKQNLIEKKFNRIEKLYLRGMVSSSVFLDSLKQKLSYLKTQYNREMTALRAFYRIRKYDGVIFEESI